MFCQQVLAVDLLNPSPIAEAKKHKLKVRRISPVAVDFVDLDIPASAGFSMNNHTDSNRPSYLALAASSWMSSAPAASPSLPSSPTPRQSLSAKVALRCCASLQEERPV
jgi:hypothetical protein